MEAIEKLMNGPLKAKGCTPEHRWIPFSQICAWPVWWPVVPQIVSSS